MSETDEQVQEGTPEANTGNATPDEGKGNGPWFDDLVKAGFEGSQLEEANRLMREQQARVTQVEQEAAKYRKPWEGVDEKTIDALSELAHDVNRSPEDTFKSLVEIAEAQGLDPRAVLGYVDDSDDTSEDIDDLDDLDLEDPLGEYPDEIRETIKWAQEEKERQAKETAEQALKREMEQTSALEDWIVKDDQGNTLKDGNGEPINVFDEELWTTAVAIYGEHARQAYAEKYHPLALAKYQIDNPRENVDVTDVPDSVHSDEGIATPEPPKEGESIFQISERLSKNYNARRTKERSRAVDQREASKS